MNDIHYSTYINYKRTNYLLIYLHFVLSSTHPWRDNTMSIFPTHTHSVGLSKTYAYLKVCITKSQFFLEKTFYLETITKSHITNLEARMHVILGLLK